MEEAAAIVRGSLGDNLSLREYDAALRKHAAACCNLYSAARAMILENSITLLETLDPTKNSIGYLTVLDIVYEGNSTPSESIMTLTLNYVRLFDPCQVRYVGATFSLLLYRIGCCRIFKPSVAMELLATAILRLDPLGATLTSTHLILAKLALNSEAADASLPVLNSEILYYPVIFNTKEAKNILCDPHLPTRSFLSPTTGLTDPITAEIVLEYEMTRAMVYISRREWAKAHATLNLIVSHPTRNRGVSKLMVEAHRKWILVSLLHEGKAPQTSFHVSLSAQNSYKTINATYLTVATLFSTHQVIELRKHLEDNRQLWEDDGNASLISEVVSAYQKWQIVNLQHIYQRVSIAVVHELTINAETGNVLPDEQTTLALVRSMLDTGFFCGEIEAGSGDEESYLTFGESMASISEEDLTREIAASHQRVVSLVKQYERTSERLSTNKDYVKHLLRDQKRLDLEKQADAGIGFETQIEDEDLMTGVLPHV